MSRVVASSRLKVPPRCWFLLAREEVLRCPKRLPPRGSVLLPLEGCGFLRLELSPPSVSPLLLPLDAGRCAPLVAEEG